MKCVGTAIPTIVNGIPSPSALPGSGQFSFSA